MSTRTTTDASDSASTVSNSYGQILSSSAIIGAASLVNMATGLLRAKVTAVWLGPAGFGLLATYGAIADLFRSVADLGISNSGVRQIADSAASGDTARIAGTAAVLRRVSIVLGLLGAALVVSMALPASILSFGDSTHVLAISMLSLVVMCRLVSDARCALLQGLRRIRELAWVNVIGAAGGTLAAIPLIYFLGERGVVPSMLAIAAATLCASLWFSHRSAVASAPGRVPRFRAETADLLRLGLAFMASGLLMSGAAYVVRIIVLRELGLDAAGLYQAAWTLGGLYVGFVLQSMGADFYPRMVGAVHDDLLCNRLVNEQACASLLMAGPGVLVTLALAPWVLGLLYSQAFTGAASALRWICLGMALRTITWPMGFVIVAQGRKMLFFVTELGWAAFNVAATWICVQRFGVAGAGIAFFLSCLLHGAIVYLIARRVSGFRWSRENLVSGLLTIFLCAAVTASFEVLAPHIALLVGVVAVLVGGCYSLRTLIAILPAHRLPRPLRRKESPA